MKQRVALGAVFFALVTGWYGWQLSSSWFLQDDFLNFAQVDESYRNPFVFLGRPDFGRFAPTHRAVHAVLWFAAGGRASWPLTLGFLSGLGALISMGLTALTWRATRSWLSTAVVLVGSGFTSPMIATLHWLASAAHVAVGLACALFAVQCALGFMRSGSRWWLWGMTLAWVLALGAYEKMYVLGPLLTLACVWATRPGWSRALQAMATFAVPALAFIVHIRSHAFATGSADLWRPELAQGFVRAFNGPWASFAQVPPLLTLVPVVVTIALSSRRAFVAAVWSAFVLSAVLLALPAAAYRLGTDGAGFGDVPRYFIEWWPAYLVVLAIASAQVWPRFQPVVQGVLIFWLLATVPAQLRAGQERISLAHSVETRRWAESAAREVGARGLPVAEAEVPSFVVERWYFPYSRVERVLSLFGGARAASSGEPALAFDERGVASPVRFTAQSAATLHFNGCVVDGSGCAKAARACRLVVSDAGGEGQTLALRVRAQGVRGRWQMAEHSDWAVDGAPSPALVGSGLAVTERAALKVDAFEFWVDQGGAFCVDEAVWGHWVRQAG